MLSRNWEIISSLNIWLNIWSEGSLIYVLEKKLGEVNLLNEYLYVEILIIDSRNTLIKKERLLIKFLTLIFLRILFLT